jgi:hypothetical protein
MVMQLGFSNSREFLVPLSTYRLLDYPVRQRCFDVTAYDVCAVTLKTLRICIQ